MIIQLLKLSLRVEGNILQGVEAHRNGGTAHAGVHAGYCLCRYDDSFKY